MSYIHKELDSLLISGRIDEAESLIFTTTQSLADSAGAMLSEGNYKGALDTYINCIELMRKYYNENIDFAELKLCISEIHALLKDYPSAISEISEAISIYENQLNPDHQCLKEAREILYNLESESAKSKTTY